MKRIKTLQALTGMVILIFCFVSQLAAQTTIQADAGCTVTVATNDLGDPAIAWDATAHAAARLYKGWKYDTELHQMLRAYNLGSNRAERIALAAGLFAICGDTVLDVLVCSPNVGYQGFRTVDGVYGYLKLVKLPSGDTSKTIVYLHPSRTWLAPVVAGERIALRSWGPRHNRVLGWISAEEANATRLSCDVEDGNGPTIVTVDCPDPPAPQSAMRLAAVTDTVRDTVWLPLTTPAATPVGGRGTFIDALYTSSQGDTAKFRGWGTSGDTLTLRGHFVVNCCDADTSATEMPEPYTRLLMGGAYQTRQLQYASLHIGAEHVWPIQGKKLAMVAGADAGLTRTVSDLGIGRYDGVDWGREHSMMTFTGHVMMEYRPGTFRLAVGPYAETYVHTEHRFTDGSFWGPTALMNGGLQARIGGEWGPVMVSLFGRVGGPLNVSHIRPVSEGGGFWPDLDEDGGGPTRGVDVQGGLILGFRL